MSMITSSPPTKGGVHPTSVADFQFAFQALSQQPFPSIPKNIASISIPQPLTRLSPQPPSSLYLPATVTTPDVGKKPSQRSLKGGNRSRNSTNDKVKKRLARKAELARASRRRKKAYIQDLEDKVNRLTQQVLTLQRERTLLGLPSTLASSTFTPISSSPRLNKNSINSDDSDSGDNEKEKNSTYETSELESNTGSSTSSTNENNLMVDGLSGLASAASRLANMEDLLELGGSKTSTESKNSSSPIKTESEEGESDLEKCEEEIKPKNKKVASPSISGRTGSGNFTVDPNLPLSLFALSQPTSQSTPTVPVPLPSRSLTTSSSTTSLSSHSPPMSSSFLSTSRVSAFTTTRQGKQESGNNERCIKASYNGDTRRFSLTEKNFTYSSLVQTLRETYQNLPSSFTIKYRDEEQDYINITTTAEFREAYRLLCLTPLSPSSPTSQTPSTPPQKILKLIIESSQSSPLGTTIKLKGKNGTSTNSSSLSRKKNPKNGSSSSRGNKRKTSISTSSAESPTSLSSCSSSTPPSPLKKQRHREIPLPPKFPSTSFPIFLQGVDTNIDEHSTIPPFCLIVDSSMTIEQLKNDIAKMQPSLSAGVYYQYSYHGQILDDNNKYIKDYGITKGSVIRLDRLESITPSRFYPSFMLPPSSTPTSSTSNASTMETDNNPLSNPLSFFFPQILPLLSTAAATSAFSESTPAITSGFSFPQLDLSSTTITTSMSSEYDTKQPRSTEYDTKLPRSTEYDTKQPRSTEYDAKQPRSMEYDMKRNKNNLSINGINLTNQPQADSTTCATLISSIKYPLMGSTPSLPVLLGA